MIGLCTAPPVSVWLAGLAESTSLVIGTYLSPYWRLTSAISHSINYHSGWQAHARLSRMSGDTRGLRWTFLFTH